MNRGSVGKAALMGGLVSAVLTATPFLSALNTCCCALVIVGGMFSAWVLRSDSGGGAGTPRCALAGGLSGVLAGLIGVPLAALLSRLAFGVGGLERRLQETMEAFRAGFDGSGQAMPPGFMDLAEKAMRSSLGLDFGAWTVALALASAMVFSFFGLLGSLLGASVFRGRKPTLPPAPAVPIGGHAPYPGSLAATPSPELPVAPPAPVPPDPFAVPPEPFGAPPSVGPIPLEDLPELPPSDDEPRED